MSYRNKPPIVLDTLKKQIQQKVMYQQIRAHSRSIVTPKHNSKDSDLLLSDSERQTQSMRRLSQSKRSSLAENRSTKMLDSDQVERRMSALARTSTPELMNKLGLNAGSRLSLGKKSNYDSKQREKSWKR